MMRIFHRSPPLLALCLIHVAILLHAGGLSTAAFAESPPIPEKLVPVGEEFQVNTYTTLDQRTPKVGLYDDGFVVIWESSRSADDPAQSIQGRRYQLDGDPVGDQFQLNTYTTGIQWNADVTTRPDGSFVGIWQNEDSTAVHSRRYDPTGSPIGGELVFESSGVTSPVGALGADGGFLVVWRHNAPTVEDPEPPSIRGLLYDAEGAPRGDDFQLNTWTTGIQTYPRAHQQGDDFLVVWKSGAQIVGRRFDGDGAPVGGEFQAGSISGSFREPSLDVWADESFIIAWTSAVAAEGGPAFTEAKARRFDSEAAPLGDEFQVIPTANEFSDTQVGTLPDGGFLIVWRGGDSLEISAQRFNASNIALGANFQVNTVTTGLQSQPVVSSDDEGDLIVAWTSSFSAGTDTDEDSVQARILRSEADIAVTVVAASPQATPGAGIEWTATALNNGPDFALGGLLAGAGSGSTCLWESTSLGGATGASPTGSSGIDERLRLPVGASVVYDVICDIDSAATGMLTFTAGIDAAAIDDVPGNNLAIAEVELIPSADLGLDLFPEGGDQVVAGGPAKLGMTVTNLGPSDSSGGAVQVALPAETTFLSSPDCTSLGQGVECSLGGIAAGDSLPLEFTVLVDGDALGSTATLDASLQQKDDDPVANNDTDSVTIHIVALFEDGFESGDASAWSGVVP